MKNLPLSQPLNQTLASFQDFQPTAADLATLWEEPITYVKQFAEALQCVNLGYFISYLTQKIMPGEWIKLNDKVVSGETGLSPKQWRIIRDRLLSRELLLNRRTSAGSEFTLNDELLEELIRQHSDITPAGMFAAPLTINRLHLKALTAAGLSFKAVLLLSLIQQETPHKALGQRGELSDWITLSEKQVSILTCLTYAEQKSALEDLASMGIVEYDTIGFPAARHCRYSLKRLAEITASYLRGN
ncbi:hypothetical protein [Neisseria arctica]|uniref:hypothetical protein n=1 Tax=Neisseria arctica TaxID=1470200 RepID=UPI00069AF4BE|nr:hypothetical protein [Neisseria arctica]UOO87668.1 hypothetical protein LVJ86_05335 [Neisseria arctica]